MLVKVESNGEFKAIIKAKGFKDGKEANVNFEYYYEPEERLINIVDCLPLYDYLDDARITAIEFPEE